MKKCRVTIYLLILILSKLLHTTKPSRTPSTNQTHLSTGGRLPAHRRRTTNVLMVTTTKGMLYWIFRHSTNLGPAVPFDGILVKGPSGLEERLVGTSASGHDTDLCTHVGGDGLFPSRGQAQTCGALVVIVRDDHGKASRSASKGTAIAHLGLNVAYNGTLGNLLQWQYIANGQRCLLSTVNELTSVHPLGGYHELGIAFEAIGIEELNLGHGGATSRIMEDFLDDTADVAATFGVVNGPELDGTLARAGVCLEDGRLTLALGLSSFIIIIIMIYH